VPYIADRRVRSRHNELMLLLIPRNGRNIMITAPIVSDAIATGWKASASGNANNALTVYAICATVQ